MIRKDADKIKDENWRSRKKVARLSLPLPLPPELYLDIYANLLFRWGSFIGGCYF
jgi:hypothetical protein